MLNHIFFVCGLLDYFYSGSVDAVDFDRTDPELRNRTNRLVSMKTNGRVTDFMQHDHVTPEGPLTLFAANYFKVTHQLRWGEMKSVRVWESVSEFGGKVLKFG